MRILTAASILGFTALFSCRTCTADTPDVSSVATIVDFKAIDPQDEAIIKTNLDVDHATILSVANARQLVLTFFQKQAIAIEGSQFSCIIHVVRWGTDSKTGKDAVIKSSWYVYNPQNSWTNQDFISNKRIFGVHNPYLLAIHLNVPADYTDDFHLAYKYSAVHRLPANVQNLISVINLAKSPTKEKLPTPPLGLWAIGTLEGNPPSDITITAEISNAGSEMKLETTNTKFDDEGLYRWDVSIAVPIVSYKQLQSVVDSSGQINQANIDTRNLLIMGNFFLKPVDVKGSTFLAVPHVVAGISMAAKPLHAAVAGIGWGPVVSNFYVGVMILTNNLPNDRLAHHYKLAFGLNLPLRTLASKLGLKTQIE